MLAGLEILAFPCNQFLKQEPGTSEDAQQFACTRYKAEYPIFHKVIRFVFPPPWAIIMGVSEQISIAHARPYTESHSGNVVAPYMKYPKRIS